ncbi:zinc-finger homeodomain protein 1-like [Mangifera indica]|uniref:zinc-finger homeodomain protein 1-like n=1 Tax=Mangifera indica TaxID=29780 RepID=UPI001CFB275E|nr:zinc-finger homeodomain protein 1-like [Mangifera indica]
MPQPNHGVQWAEPAGASYSECRRNHAAAMGCYATDCCGEFLRAGIDGTSDAFLCAACGCHRSFHRKEMLNNPHYSLPALHNELTGGGFNREKKMKLKKKTKWTKLNPEQKDKMKRFANKLGWRPQKHDEEVEQFCDEVGISRKIFKVWLCNNRRRTEGSCVVTKEQSHQDVEED